MADVGTRQSQAFSADHLLDVGLAEAAALVGDGDLVRPAGRAVLSGDLAASNQFRRVFPGGPRRPLLIAGDVAAT